MCTKLLLAFLYLLILFIINFFLFKLFQKKLKKIVFLQKIEKIFYLVKKNPPCSGIKNKSVFYYLIHYQTLSKKRFGLLSSFNLLFKKKDILLIGYSYYFIAKKIKINFQEQEKKEFFQKEKVRVYYLYLKLLKNQYLSY